MFSALSSMRVPWAKTVGVKQSPLITEYSKADLLRLQIFIKDCNAEYSWTPDWLKLEQQEYQWVFLYCNLMSGGSRHHEIEGLYVSTNEDGLSVNPYAFSGRPNWEVWQTKDGRDSFPVALTSGPQVSKLTVNPGSITKYPLRGYVKGRLYKIRSSELRELDKIKQNGVLFERRRVWVKLPYRIQDFNLTGVNAGDEQVFAAEVWMYVGRKEYWGEVPQIKLERCGVSHFSQKKRFRFQQKAGMYEKDLILPFKRWIDDQPFYYFRAWEIANK